MTVFDDPLLLLALVLMVAGIYLARTQHKAQQYKRLEIRMRGHLPVASAEVASQENILRGQGTALSPWLEKILQPVATQGERLSGSDRDRRNLRRLLDLAGLRRNEAVGWLVMGKFVAGALFAIALVWGWLPPADRAGLTGVAAGLIGFFVGSMVPEWWLKWRAASRGEKLARAVPDALDLMVVCAEAGLPIGRVLQVVSKELGLSSPEMADELHYTAAELQILSDRTLAMKHLAERTRVSEIESMVATLIQAERYGTPLSQALRTIADESRKTLILGLEEKAGKLPAQLSVPLMALILPPIIAIMASPALVRVIRLLAQ
ncbi:type II secretion system F family protein [Pectobacterium sp. FL60-S17]|uniref:Type II secretion system F family protein n=2 Tax=Pectobacterium TaxID=122277 RepID=A0A9Q2I893_9GAMM|nr:MULTISPECIES: type II secretion system F family protein [Pectobacterium]MBE5203503.1 type II secretion system F family protein [Pectobacterium quasiaquaticum]MBE5211734.1 type II secretion system F family protein [Pectobacterium quasiaquaticum]MBE5220459.1 type II secretion system F family protein [Pectobacterium quasiaquaticum]MBN3053354.1 type II secretion system F family protein [Pectobacterium brasiliense]URG49646.1 type II secretion system F family protein [Pectobacterium quasiaquaticu